MHRYLHTNVTYSYMLYGGRYGAMYEIAPSVVVFLYGGELDAVACGCTPALRQVVFRVDERERRLVAL